MFHKRRSFFPFLMAIATLALFLLVLYAFSSRMKETTQSSGNGYAIANDQTSSAEPVTEQGYRDAAHPIVSTFLSVDMASASDEQKRAAVETAYNNLLALRVPADYKELHMSLATSLFLMRESLYDADSASFDDGYARFQAVVADNPWLK